MADVTVHHSGGIGTAEEIAYENRAAENALFTASRVVIGAFGFAFAALAFAYFYLRAANDQDMWRPHGITAPTAIGTAVMAFAVFAAVLVGFGHRQLRRNSVLDWQVASWVAVGSGLVALGLQCWELTDLSFFPGSSGYSSCFVGWSVMNIGLLVAGVFWAETLVARHVHLRRARAEEGAIGEVAILPRFRINVEGSANFWAFIAFVSVFFWVFFYVTR